MLGCYRKFTIKYLASICLLGSIAVSRQSFAKYEYPEPVGSDAPNLEDLITKIKSSLVECARLSSNDFEGVQNQDQYMAGVRTLHTIRMASTPKVVDWKENHDFQEQLEDLIVESLRLELHTPLSIAHVFHALNWLPQSQDTSFIIMEGLSVSGGNSVYVWKYRLYDRISNDVLDSKRVELTQTDWLRDVDRSALAMISAIGTEVDLGILKQLHGKALSEEMRSVRRPPSGCSSEDLMRLLNLQTERHSNISMLEWAVNEPGFGNSAAAFWAVEIVLKNLGTESVHWQSFWELLEVRADDRLDRYTDRIIDVPVSSLNPNWSEIFIANDLLPWIQWAEAKRLQVPDFILNRSPTDLRINDEVISSN